MRSPDLTIGFGAKPVGDLPYKRSIDGANEPPEGSGISGGSQSPAGPTF